MTQKLEPLIIVETVSRSSISLIFVLPTDILSSHHYGMETDQLHKVNLDWRKFSKTDPGTKNGLSGANTYDHFVMRVQIDSSRALVSGQPRYIHHNDYGHLITPVRPIYYTAGIETIGMTTRSTSLMNMNTMMTMFLILYPK